MTGTTITNALQPAARAAGTALGATTGALGHALHRVKPLHPEGELFRATITRVGARGLAAGVPWLETAGESPAIVRVSRAVGLPHPLPDIVGLAIRVDPSEHAADLLLASTGTGRLGRFVLRPHLPGRTGTLTSLLPYRTPAGPLLLAAAPAAHGGFELQWALGTGAWRTFGLLHLGAPYDGDPPVSFDPVLHVLPGLAHYDWVRRLREPAYRTAREQSDRDVSG
jgi:hypothetical protein